MPDEGGKITDADLAAAAPRQRICLRPATRTQRAVAKSRNRRAGHGHADCRRLHQDGFTCRDFLASVVREEAEAWLQGEACRVHHGKWVVRTMKPWKRA